MPESTLRGILKKKGLLLAEAEKGGRMKSRKNIREGRHAELDEVVESDDDDDFEEDIPCADVVAAFKLVRKFVQKNNLGNDVA